MWYCGRELALYTIRIESVSPVNDVEAESVSMVKSANLYKSDMKNHSIFKN